MAEWTGGADPEEEEGEQEDSIPKKCGYCDKTDGKLRRCGQCRSVAYCSRECQRSDWKNGHKIQCNALRRSRENSNVEGVPSCEDKQTACGQDTNGTAERSTEGAFSIYRDYQALMQLHTGKSSQITQLLGLPGSCAKPQHVQEVSSATNLVQETQQNGNDRLENNAPTSRSAQVKAEGVINNCKSTQTENCEGCSYCGASDKKLTNCAVCAVVRYCSEDCQRMDWSAKHRAECKGLADAMCRVQRESTRGDERSEGEAGAAKSSTRMSGKPWSFGVRYQVLKMCVFEDKLVIAAALLETKDTSVKVFDISTGRKESNICTVCVDHEVTTVDVLRVGGAHYVVLVLSRELVQLYPYPKAQSRAVYTYETRFSSSCHVFHKGMMYVEDMLSHSIQETNTTVIPFKSTGRRFQSSLFFGHIVHTMCVLENNGKPYIVMMHNTEDNDTQAFVCSVPSHLRRQIVTCINMRGARMWKLDKYKLDGLEINPCDITADNIGHVFVADGVNRRIVVVRVSGAACPRGSTVSAHKAGCCDYSVRHLVSTPGVVGRVEWCAADRKVLAVYENDKSKKTMVVCYQFNQSALDGET